MENLVVYYDMETTGLNPHTDQILQIGAVSSDGRQFMRYVTPPPAISASASNVNGFTTDGSGKLFKNGVEVNTLPLSQALREFVTFLDGLGMAGRVLLVAHNGQQYYNVMLLRSLGQARLRKRLYDTVKGFDDTLVVLRRLYQYNRSLRLCDLAKDVVGVYIPHDALVDAEVLRAVSQRHCLEAAFQPHRS